MRAHPALRSVAKAYVLGGLWAAVMLGVVMASVDAMSGLYASVGLTDPALAAAATTTLAVGAATLVTASVWVLLRRSNADPSRATERGVTTHAPDPSGRPSPA
ncbi:MAG: hypothetical protein PVG27_08765 [Chloroflexota bacterium]